MRFEGSFSERFVLDMDVFRRGIGDVRLPTVLTVVSVSLFGIGISLSHALYNTKTICLS